MSPEKQRIAIAEVRGWKSVRKDVVHGILGFDSTNDPFPHDKGFQKIPDCLNDLNAMHEAILSLPQDKLEDFAANARDLICWPHMTHFQMIGRLLTMGADELAESFLRTLGLWEDGE